MYATATEENRACGDEWDRESKYCIDRQKETDI